MRIYALISLGILLAVPALLSAQSQASCAPDGKIQFVCGQTAPEDLVYIPGTDWVVASAFNGAGGIHLINVRDKTSSVLYPSASAKDQLDKKTYDTCPGPADAEDKAKFTTHGLALRAGRNSTYTLYAVHHGKRESIEVFELDVRAKTPSVTWVGCVIAPDPIGLNSVIGLPDGFIATNFLERGANAAAARTKMMAGENNGELWEWHTKKGWTKVPGSEASGPNGIEISKDGKTLYVAAWGSQSFFRMSRGQTPVKRDAAIQLGFRVDNIRFAPDGSIYAAGQGMNTSNVVKIDPNTLKVTEIINQPNTQMFSSGTVAVEIGKELWVGSFRGDRIAIFPAGK